jgi:hypothetical protein
MAPPLLCPEGQGASAAALSGETGTGGIAFGEEGKSDLLIAYCTFLFK